MKILEELKGWLDLYPQDDMLIEELTVYQNLYFNGRLCLATIMRAAKNIVQKVLQDLDLYDIRDLQVGDLMNRRWVEVRGKGLILALSWCANLPFSYDEPTSGLSLICFWKSNDPSQESVISGNWFSLSYISHHRILSRCLTGCAAR